MITKINNLLKYLTFLFILISSCSWADITTNLQVLVDCENRYSDQSGIGRTINKDGTTSYVAGKVGSYALEFGTGGYITIYDSPGNIDSVADFTYALWIKMPDTTSNFDNILLKPSAYKLRRKDTANGSTWTAYVFDDAAHRQDPVSANNAGATTEWTHIALTVRLTGAGTTIVWYVNGTAVQTITDPASWTDVLAGSTDNATCGALGVAVDDVRLFNRALSSSDITELVALGDSATPTPTNTTANTPTFTPTITDTPVNTPTPTATNTYNISLNRKLWIDFENRYSDQSGSARTVNKTGTMNYITGVHGYAGEFQPSSYLSFLDSPTGTDNVASLSWAGWFKRPDTTTETDNIVFKSSVFKLRADISGDGEWSGYVIDNAAHQAWPASNGDAAETTDWTHIGMTADLAGANNTILWYINGLIYDTLNPSPYGDLLGNTSDSGSVGQGGLAVDEFMIWDRVVNPTEMFILAELPAPTQTPTPTGPTPTPTVTNTPTITATPTNTFDTPTPTNTVPSPTPTNTVSAIYKYVRSGASGSANGNDWTNAYTALPDPLTRGTTYLVSDGNYIGYNFNDADSGNLLITVQKATITAHGTDTGWDNTYGDGYAQFTGNIYINCNYLKFDGVTGGGPNNWESGFGFCFDYTGWHLIHIEGTHHDISFYHCDMESGGRSSLNTEDQIFYAINSPYNITISYCWMHDVRVCQLTTRSGHNYLIEYTKLSRNGGGGITSHREAWSGSNESNVIVRYCFFEDISNSAFIGLVNGNGNADNWEIYGNLFVHSGDLIEGDNQVSPAIILTKYADVTTIVARNWKIYNNTIANINGQAGLRIMEAQTLSGIKAQVRNNIWWGNWGYAAIHSPSDTIDIDYNYYADNRNASNADLDVAAAAAEAHSTAGSGDPFTSYTTKDWSLSSPLSGATSLSSPYDVDMYGNTRGADGTWDLGALEFVEDGPTPTATSTITPTPTGGTPTPTETIPTVTPTPTKTATITNTPTITLTPTVTNTITQTFTLTITQTPTITLTPTITNTYDPRPKWYRWLPTPVPNVNIRNTPTPKPFKNPWARKH